MAVAISSALQPIVIFWPDWRGERFFAILR
jgi:hypothetical protein